MTKPAKNSQSKEKTGKPNRDVSLDDFILVDLFARRYPNLGTPASWRWRIFNANHNGLADAGVIVRANGHVYIVQSRALDYFLGMAA